MEPITLGATAAKLIFTGACLAVGFWAGKKLTNRIDHFIYTHSEQFKRDCAQFAQPAQSQEEIV